MIKIEVKMANDNAFSRHQAYTHCVVKTYANGNVSTSYYRSQGAASRAANQMRKYESI